MGLEILIKDNIIKISADWFWYMVMTLWFISSTVSNCYNIYKHIASRRNRPAKTEVR